MPKKFKLKLSTNEIENLKNELWHYRDVELPNKCKILVQRLAEIGLQTANVYVGESPLGKYVIFKIEEMPIGLDYKAVLIGTGAVKRSEGYEDFNTLLAIEFGAGIYYNNKKNPHADKLGFGVGTFPGQIHAFEDGWYYWNEQEQKWKYTHGVKATMPMYNAEVEIIRRAVEIAREVFK